MVKKNPNKGEITALSYDNESENKWICVSFFGPKCTKFENNEYTVKFIPKKQ
jgi:hypothetical protein